MSFWTRIGVKITDIECFKQACRQHNIEYQENTDENFRWQGNRVVATLKDLGQNASNYYSSQAFLVESDGALKVAMDTHRQYSSIVDRIGTKLTRDYTKNVVEKGVRRAGGMVNSVQEQPDGSVIVRITAVA